jgi:hypothetical protein
MHWRVSLAVLIVGSVLIAAAPALASHHSKVARPIKVKNQAHQIHTSIGHYCPANAGCPVAPSDPHPKPRLRARSHQHLRIVTHKPAQDLRVALTKPKANPDNGTITLARGDAHAAGSQEQHWRFILPRGVRGATALEITAGYRRGSAFYVGGIKVHPRKFLP